MLPDSPAPEADDFTKTDEVAEAPREVDDILEMVSLVELSDVYVWEERGRRIDETATEEDREPRIRQVLNVGDRDDFLGVAFRFRMSVDDRQGNEFIADYQARYELAAPAQFTSEVRAEFAERVAFFTVYPYLRASIQMTASRMGAPAPVLAIVRAGEFKLGTTMTDEAVATEFRDTVPEA
ncbi:hypothetical protein [Curtobacterium sp. 20TX0008]|uniref:hypothetical protein n=1 Tax=Curtobacterium sp. 20TX0008 TaxID=3022018 RepID=UPI00232D2815|nr:hypothetical protein [Curtobacterium sp. 20TX0008]MDB6425942.1 hypothetical protein [Curtobacterium sp. 20TX0008]